MRLPPMLASLTRHKLTVALMLLATAFTCAIVTNIAALIAHRLALLDAPSGVDEASVVLFNSSLVKAAGFDPTHQTLGYFPQYQADLAALRGLPGVRSAAVVSGLPMAGGMGFSVTTQAQGTQAHAVDVNAFVGGPGELQTLGLQLVAGRDFQASEYVLRGKGKAAAAIISRALAERLFHGGDATGRLIYRNGQPLRIVGVVAHLMNMYPRLGATDNEYTMLLPVGPNGPYATFVLRTAPARRDTVLKHAMQVLAQHHPERIFSNAQTFAQLRAQFFSQASAMVGLLLAAAIGLLLVTAAGIAGLASFWVQQRTRSIGIRRALGATRAEVLRYTHVENFVIVTAGVVLGGALAYGLNALLMEYHAMQLLPPAYLVMGAVALWLMGQLAVLAPSLHAGAVPPAVATRSV